MNNLKKLILFTDSYPYGKGEQFLETEIDYLSTSFDRVVIMPMKYGGCKEARDVPGNVHVLSPFFKRSLAVYMLIKGVCNRSPFFPLLREGVKEQVYESPRKLKKWLAATLIIRHVLNHHHLKLLQGSTTHTLLYFYWGCGAAWMLPFMKRPIKSVIRFHGYDLYENEQGNPGYIPFRKQQLLALDVAVFISQHGKDYLTSRYPNIGAYSKFFPLGVKEQRPSRLGDDGILRVVSCSLMRRLKRIDLIIEALKLIEFPVEWTHIGDGPLRSRLEECAKALPANVQYTFVGQWPNERVLNFYTNSSIDLCLNVSQVEGLPVSIMEALAAGIPVFATDVGGVSELVDENVGRLFHVDVDPRMIAQAIRAYHQSGRAKQELAIEARKRWQQCVDADKNYHLFSSFLRELVPEKEEIF
ncbi:MAG: glycosyltransferase [Kiritimatiellae bacterium]|nr:glycosyltransferase [Kiritimatiellia bacterium]